MTDAIPTTRDRPGSYDAIATAKPDEPLFPIQGGDPFGPPTVLHWVSLCRKAGMAATDPKEAERLLRKATDAEQVAWAMQAYQRGQAEVAGARVAYSDHIPEIDGADERHARETLIRASDRLHAILAEALTVAETLAKLRRHPEAEVKVRNGVEMFREAAFEIEPRRGSERS